MEDAIEQLQTKDTKERLSGVERLQVLLEQSRKSLTANEVGSLVDASLVLLKDNNFRVAHGTLQALASAAALAGEHLKLHFNALLPAIVERLGDGKQPVRDASRQLLLALMEISSPTIIVERARGFAWGHRKWRVREEFARTVASAVNLFAATELPFQRMLLPSVLQLLEDPNSSVREAAMLCLEEMYRQGGSQFRDELQGYQLRPAQFRDIAVRFETIGPTRGSLEASINANAPSSQLSISGGPERKLSVPTPSARRSSPRVKPASIDVSGGSDRDALDNHVEAIRVFSEKELIKEMEKAAALLTPEQDWSVRIAAMQRLEGLVVGGAAEYACFMPLMKQLVGPLTSQLSDRRSSIVKQACQLLNLMSKELLVNFEIFAESFIPVLFKLVVITVLVIAESADICIKTMLRNCRVSRVLPKLVECAKHDRNSVLRARCCEYALLVLEQWGHSPEIQRSVELYEELIKCCVGDAMSEVRCTARSCYRVFSKCWPERARRIFVTFDASVQRLVNEESAGPLKRYPFQSSHDWGSYADQHQLRQSSDVAVTALRPPVANHTALGGYSNAVETNAESGSSALGFPLNKAYGRNSVEVSQDKALSKILLASQQQVSAIESMLKGAGKMDKVRSFGNSEKAPEVSEKGSLYSTLGDSSSNRIGVDRPSARDPPYPASAPASNQGVALGSSRPASSGSVGGVDNFAHQSGIYSTDRAYGHTGLDSDSSGNDDGFLTTGAATRSLNGYFGGDKGAKRVMRAEYVDKGLLDSSSIPAYQRPLLRQRSSGMNRNAGDENPLLAQFNTRGGDMFKYGENVTPLSDALTEGLSGSSDWSARVAAFTALRKLFQQGPKGLQEINQSFALVMKLFSAHLDDPHHKVAQAALSTLADLVPACRKPFEAYLERILPHLFGRLVDPKEMIRQLGATSLEVIGNTYSIDSLLPALLRSLDEQRSPKAKVTVIEFAMVAFAKLASKNGESAAGTSLLRLWLAKLGPLANDKNPKLKETAVTGIISVYSHFDSTTVLNFILGLSIEEQSVLRRSLKQYTPRIEVDLMTYLQNKSHRGRPKSVHDQMDSSSPSDNYIEPSRSAYSSLTNNQSGMGYSSSSVNSDGGRKWRGGQHEVSETGNRLSHHLSATDSNLDNYRSFEPSPSSVGDSLGYLNVDRNQPGKMKEVMNDVDGVDHKPTRSALWLGDAERHSVAIGHEDKVDSKESVANFDPRAGTVLLPESTKRSQFQSEALVKYDDKFVWKGGQRPGSEGDEVTVPELLEQMVDPSIPKKKKYDIFHLLTSTRINDSAAWSEHFDHIWAIILEAIDGDDDDGAIKELALSTTLDVLNHQRQRLVDSTELLLEKLLLAAACPDLKVSNAADGCKAIVLAEFDPHRCLAVVVRLLLSKDEKLLVTCISSLTKLVGRLSNEELMAQLPSFLPALFDAFGNRNADVRKTVVFCLVEVYIVLGKAFVPYLGSLSSTQLRLVTIYANRISQARTGTALESLQL